MRKMLAPVLLAGLVLAGCETMDGGGDGYLTHSDHRLTSSERTAVEAGLRNYLKVPVSVSGLKTSYRLSDGGVVICGYVVGQVRGRAAPPALFSGTLAAPGSASFTPLRVPGKGQDPQRIAAVRAFCQAEQINI